MAFDYTNYTPVEYIQSSGTQYIQSPITATDGIFDMDIKFNSVNTTSNRTIYFGCRVASGNIVDFLHTRSASLGYGFKGVWKDGLFGYSADTIYHITASLLISPQSASLNIDGDDYGTTGGFSAVSSSSYTHDILAYNSVSSGGGHQIPAIGASLYSLKWYNASGNLLYDFVPCITKDPTPVAGLYETINGVFYGNDGTGVFAYGSPIVTGSNVWIKDSGTWKQADTVYIKDAGVWKAATNVYIKDSGSWKS